MDASTPLYVFLLAGLAVGAISGLGTSGIMGIVIAACVLGAPFYIFFTVGGKLMPFVLFFGGLMITVSFFHRRRMHAENMKRRADIDEGKKRMGLR
jgi:hypothetical protein